MQQDLPSSSRDGKKLHVVFCHPDLGIGGAERLIVDAAAELAARGHSVRVFTAHHDPHRCFPETIDGTFPVHVHGSFLPRHIAGRFQAVCAYLRCLWAALCIVISVWLRWIPAVDAIITDQVSAVHPILRLLPAKILFYCHFPDLLLAQRGSWLRSLYRAPIDWVEQVTTGMADTIVVNSHFTAATFASTFPSLASHGIRPAVLYPAVALDSPPPASSATTASTAIDATAASRGGSGTLGPAFDEAEKLGLDLNSPFFLSINPYERKKEIATAVSALGLLTRSSAHTGASDSQDATAAALAKGQRPRLVVAGGCDARVRENVEYLQELKQLAVMEGVASDVLFLTSISDSLKAQLLSHCTAVVYTPPCHWKPWQQASQCWHATVEDPQRAYWTAQQASYAVQTQQPLLCCIDPPTPPSSSLPHLLSPPPNPAPASPSTLSPSSPQNEHFGIVPLEAMAASKPVLACNSGGPTESILDGATGFLCAPNPSSFAAALATLWADPSRAASMGLVARVHVEEQFSRKVFGDRLQEILWNMCL
ncbi:unnamed protein product [Closterium sp. Naga37s-1]|nr:unnamed protein product [Closterium sp. Naga37s-1]